MSLPWDIDYLYRIFLVLTRLGAMLFLVPIFSVRSIPPAAKVAFAFILSVIVAGFLPSGDLPANAFGFLLNMLNELMVGLLLGFVIRIAFQIVNFAGELWGQQGYFTRDQTFDPMTGASSTATERLLYNFAVVIFVSLGLHLKLLGDFVSSYDIVGPGQWVVSQALINELIYQTGQIFIVGVQIAAPMIAVNFVINTTFAVLGKAAPQMNVFMVSFAVIIFTGLSLMLMGINVIEHTIIDILAESAKKLLYVLQLQ